MFGGGVGVGLLVSRTRWATGLLLGMAWAQTRARQCLTDWWCPAAEIQVPAKRPDFPTFCDPPPKSGWVLPCEKLD